MACTLKGTGVRKRMEEYEKYKDLFIKLRDKNLKKNPFSTHFYLYPSICIFLYSRYFQLDQGETDKKKRENETFFPYVYA